MAREFIVIPNQTVEPGADVLFESDGLMFNRGVFHNGGSGLFKLASPNVLGFRCPMRGIPVASYVVSFHGNILIPTDGTVGEVSLTLIQDGVTDTASQMLATPTAVEIAENVGAGIIVSVPWICRCSNVALRNTSDQAIEIVNGTLIIGDPSLGYLREGVF